jgi:Kef-type K+ transport system membrane component KefB
VAIGILAGSILVARSPSSAIAIVRELHASGPFTRTALGVTVLIDVAVIILFTINSEMANVMLTGRDINLLVHIKLVVELAAALVIGWIISYILSKLISTNWPFQIKIAGILFIGFHIFYLSELLVEYTHTRYNFDFHIEPLLTAMAASFWIVNKTVHRHEWLKLIHIIGPVIYIAFFTLTGISLSLDILLMTWPITLILFGVRLGAIFLGSFTGGVIAGDSMEKPDPVDGLHYSSRCWSGIGKECGWCLSRFWGFLCDGYHFSYCFKSDCRTSLFQMGNQAYGRSPCAG